MRDSNDKIGELIRKRRKGWSLERPFYIDPDLYRADIDRIWRRQWLFAGHSCEAAAPGDYFTYELDGDSVIVARQDDQTLRAFYNTCRHRGSRLVAKENGHCKSFVCPYHQWSYAKDGRLVNFGGTNEGLNRAEFSLENAHVKEVAGLVFVCLADTPPDMSAAEEAIRAQLTVHQLTRAKVAFVEEYVVNANWKLVWENNRECFHCRLGHPEYIKANYDIASPHDLAVKAEIEAIYEKHSANWKEHGIDVNFRSGGVPFFPTPGVWWRSVRTVFREGWVTQSLDGQPVSIPMGDFKNYHLGNLRVSTLPTLWHHANPDYSMSTRVIPLSAETTHVRVTWLVRENAVEGKDYTLEKLLPMWKLTGEQDWRLSETNHLGVRSTRYQPGPYSTEREYNVDNFVTWYLDCLEGKQ